MGLLLLLVSTNAGYTMPQYTITDLGEAWGWFARINDSGQVVLTTGREYVVLYDKGTFTNIGGLSGSSDSKSYGINKSGQITGVSHYSVGGFDRAFIYDNGTMIDLGTLGGSNSTAYGMNNLGQVVGSSSVASAPYGGYAFLYNNGSMTNLGSLSGNGESCALDINDNGQVVGWSSVTGSAFQRAFLYDNGTMIDLGTLGEGQSRAYAINNTGQIVGTVSVFISGEHKNHAMLYANGVMTDLGTLGGALSSANDINDSGQIVGAATITDGNVYHGFIYQNGIMTDLNSLIDPSLGWYIQYAQAINNSGQIVGTGFINGVEHAYLLTPKSVPEPASVTIDIKPGVYPNTINLGANSSVPVAILKTTDFDPSTINLDAVSFAGASPLRNKRNAILNKITDVNSDGNMDLILYFSLSTLSELNNSSALATLTGRTITGMDFTGTDSVQIVTKGKK